MGDDVQALKAGVLEIGEVIVINKADREGADRLANQIKTVMRLLPSPEGAWIPPIVKTIAADGTGVTELGAAIERHRAYLAQDGRLEAKRRARLKTELLERTRDLVLRRILNDLEESGRLTQVLDDLETGRIDPAAAAHLLAGG
jgi:LAO/AO transport system kinase